MTGLEQLAMLFGFGALAGDPHAEGMAQFGNGADNGAGFLRFWQLRGPVGRFLRKTTLSENN